MTEDKTRTDLPPFASHMDALDSVESVEKHVGDDGKHYWLVTPAEPIITPDVARVLGQHNVDALPHEDGLLVETGGVLFTDDDVDLIQTAVAEVMNRDDQNALDVAADASALAEAGDFENVADALAGMRDVDDLVRLLFFDGDEPLIDPEADVEWVVLTLPTAAEEEA